jgi:CheY-like chemotaxis protein
VHATNLADAIEYLGSENISVIVSDTRVDNMDTTRLLKMLKQKHPQLVTVIFSEVKDATELIELINQGQIYRFVPKPVKVGYLKIVIQSALGKHKQSGYSQAPHRRRHRHRGRERPDGGCCASGRAEVGWFNTIGRQCFPVAKGHERLHAPVQGVISRRASGLSSASRLEVMTKVAVGLDAVADDPVHQQQLDAKNHVYRVFGLGTYFITQAGQILLKASVLMQVLRQKRIARLLHQ